VPGSAYPWTPVFDQEYRYAAAANDGRLTQMKDWVSGEEVSYQYDALSRLISAVTTGPEWGLTFSYDGFGNLLNQQVTKGTAYGMSLAYNGLTNRISSGGYGYDANGNLTAMPYLGLTYDAQNRLTRAVHTVNGTEEYGYDPRNHRVWHKQANGEEYFYFYGPNGERLGRYRLRT
jgi:YD repeat-containing protein